MARGYRSELANRETYVYRLYDAGARLVYVGMTVNPRGRFAKHTQKPWWALVDHVDMEAHPDRDTARAAEARAIAREHPVYNVAGA